ncbi:YeiH family protein [Pigmentiphaga litoralis]|uniref:Putative integral membrane protein (TIGR00698 family) n=1 Tax=Pigmentiphaga litoralis TaxID=516702 RepID=A0A7Y9J0W3_9BURK|nr:YeiH family protein [Pigmentiphaga litoralis]NYE26511.1 putative integral membrane protein (TIGR00698 family) [Pigmentiphaga litoralis]NYE86078.1 putative integral membrane protein (TIGR00698 family) [Pigmentiphaga litoralis]
MSATPDSLVLRPPLFKGRVPGILLAGVVGAIALGLSTLPSVAGLGLSALTLAIVIGIVLGNTVYPRIAVQANPGVDFAKSTLLRAGIILYGFQISFQQIAQVGLAGILIAALIVGLTFTLAVQLGTRVFKLDRETSMLIGAGSAICGAAAVMACEPVVKGQANKVSVAIATVVVFGTLSMFLYPFLYPLLGMNQEAFGIFAGSTIHEVAQVVAAGNAVGQEAANMAVIEKMIRVMMLAPFLLLLSGFKRNDPQRAESGLAGGSGQQRSKLCIPWFAVWFIVASGINSLQIIPREVVSVLLKLDILLLATAMAALGMRTHIGAIRQAGAKPLVLAATLFVFLLVGGLLINLGVMQLTGVPIR